MTVKPVSDVRSSGLGWLKNTNRCNLASVHPEHVETDELVIVRTIAWLQRKERQCVAFFVALCDAEWPVTTSAICNSLTWIVLAELLVGILGDIIMLLARISLQWMAWWVLP